MLQWPSSILVNIAADLAEAFVKNLPSRRVFRLIWHSESVYDSFVFYFTLDIYFMRFLNFVLPFAFSIRLLLCIYIYMGITELLMLGGFQEAIAVPLGGWASLLLVVGVLIATVKRKVKAFEVSSRKAV